MSTFYFLETGLDLKDTLSLPPSPKHATTPDFLHEFQRSNSGHSAFTASSLLTKLSSQPHFLNEFFLIFYCVYSLYVVACSIRTFSYKYIMYVKYILSLPPSLSVPLSSHNFALLDNFTFTFVSYIQWKILCLNLASSHCPNI